MGYSSEFRAAFSMPPVGQPAGLFLSKFAISTIGAVMFIRSSSLWISYSNDLLGHLLHRITTLIFITCAICLLIGTGQIGICAEKRRVPNILLIVADDKY
jgi:hypothetical protein